MITENKHPETTNYIEKKVDELIRLYHITRHTGHTTLMLDGAKNFDRPYALIVPSIKYGQELKKANDLNHVLIVSLEKLSDLDSMHVPVCFDNLTIMSLLDNIGRHFNKQNDTISKLKDVFAMNKGYWKELMTTVNDTRLCYIMEHPHGVPLPPEILSGTKDLIKLYQANVKRLEMDIAEKDLHTHKLEHSIFYYIKIRFNNFIDRIIHWLER